MDSNLENIEETLNNIFRSPAADEKFESVLAVAGRAKLTVLTKAISLVGNCDVDYNSQKENQNESSKRSQMIAVNILKAVLRLTIRNYQVSSDEITDVTCCIVIGARNFPSESLSQVVTFCVDYMELNQSNDLPSQWIEIFGCAVSILTSRREIEYDDDVLSGKEFRAAVVNQLCRMEWGANNTPYLISAIREFPDLDVAEIDQVIDTAQRAMKSLDPLAIPPIAYQLLLLGSDKRPKLLLQSFNEYFEGMIFQESVLTASQPVHTSQLKRKALGTVVYHVIHSARHSSALVREMIRRIKNSSLDHNLVMTPFILSTCLGLTSIEHFKSQVVEGLRRSIISSLSDVRNCQVNAWYHSARGDVQETFMDCFKSVIDSKSSELDFMLDGLRDLALALLQVDDLQSENPCSLDKCKALGSYIISAIVKKHPEYFAKVIDDLLRNRKSVVHINCLANCLRSMIRNIVQSKMSERITELINHLPLMTVDTASPIIKALIPSFQLSRKLLSDMIVVLRKTVYKSIEARKITAQAMILLLSNSRIIGAIPRSQYSESQAVFSQATQTQVEILGTPRENESLCFEVLWILKRFFTQPSEVREQLYLGLHVVSRKNPELIKVICSHLLSQVHQQMNEEKNEIRMMGLLDCSNSAVVIHTEQLGYLIQCVSFVTLRGRRIYRRNSDDQPATLLSCETLLETWIEIMAKLKIEDIEIAAASMAGGSVGSLRPLESVKDIRNALILQILQTIEALVEYIALSGDTRGDENFQAIFKKFLEFLPLLKPTKPKTSKKDTDKGRPPSKKKKGSNKSNSQSGTPAEAQGPKIKLKSESPKSLIHVHILNLESIVEILKHFSSSDSTGLNLAVRKKDFEKFVLGVIKQKVERMKNKEDLGERERKPEQLVTTIASIAGALWEICRKRDLATDNVSLSTNFDANTEDEDIQVIEEEPTSLTSLRFQILLDLVEFLTEQNTLEFTEVLRLFNFEVFEDKSFDDMFEDFFEAWSLLVIQCCSNGSSCKELEFLFAILVAFGKSLTPGASESTRKALEWCLNFTKDPKELEPSVELCGLVMSAILSLGSKLEGAPEKYFLKLARQAHCILGDVDEELAEFTDSEQEQPWLFNKTTAPMVICSIGLYVEENLSFVTTVIRRLKVQSQYYRLEKLEDLRDKICTMLTFIINLSTELIRSCFPAGPCVDILQRVMDQVFITTTLLTEHLIEVHSKNKIEFTAKKFVNLVKLIGKDFKLRVEALIAHIECIQRDKVEELIKSKKGGRVPAAMKQKFMKDSKTIPDLIYHVEKYEQQLYALEQKAKVDLLAGTKLSTARDFRIEVRELKEALAETKKKTKSAKEPNVSDASNESSSLQQSGLSRLQPEEVAASTRKPRGSLKRKRN